MAETELARTTASGLLRSGWAVLARVREARKRIGIAEFRDRFAQPVQVPSLISHLYVEARFRGRGPFHRQQPRQPLIDLGRGRAAIADQRAAGARNPVLKVGNGGFREERLGVAANDHDLISVEELRIAQELGRTVENLPFLQFAGPCQARSREPRRPGLPAILRCCGRCCAT